MSTSVVERIAAGLQKSGEDMKREIEADLNALGETVRKLQSSRSVLADDSIGFGMMQAANTSLNQATVELKARKETILRKLRAVHDDDFRQLVNGYFAKINAD